MKFKFKKLTLADYLIFFLLLLISLFFNERFKEKYSLYELFTFKTLDLIVENQVYSSLQKKIELTDNLIHTLQDTQIADSDCIFRTGVRGRGPMLEKIYWLDILHPEMDYIKRCRKVFYGKINDLYLNILENLLTDQITKISAEKEQIERTRNAMSEYFNNQVKTKIDLTDPALFDVLFYGITNQTKVMINQEGLQKFKSNIKDQNFIEVQNNNVTIMISNKKTLILTIIFNIFILILLIARRNTKAISTLIFKKNYFG
tara:strand:- start:3915 stop:4691 length:777 start_codon:yes stop_codon:yes gene_type:complete